MMFGRRYRADDRDKQYRLRRLNSGRARRFWRDDAWWGDQGDTPTCVGYAWAHWLANAPIIQRLRAEGIYFLAKHLDEWPGENYAGTSVRAGAKALFELGFIREYRWAWSLPLLIDTVLELGPVVVGTNWYGGMNTPDRNGVLSVSGKLEGGHAWLINGVDVEKELFRLKQSWGRGWGLQGRAWISFKDMRRLIREDGEICCATEADVRHAA